MAPTRICQGNRMSRGTASTQSARIELLEAVAPGLARDHFAALAQSKHRVVRETIAARPDAPLGVLAALANDGQAEVRAVVASNPSAAPAIIEGLSEDHNASVALSLAHNPSAPRAVLLRLVTHRKANVRAAAMGRLAEEIASATPSDPDARVPELREMPPITVAVWPAAPRAAAQVSVDDTGTGSLSLLATRLALRTTLVSSAQAGAARELHLGVAAAS